MTLIDSNVLLDVFGRDPHWWPWSLAQLKEAARRGPLYINDIIYAETSIRFPDAAMFDAALDEINVVLATVPRMVPFLAGKAFARYREAGGVRNSILPDFFIGAHAEVERLPLLTRDARRYRSYFPNLTLIAPDTV